MCLNGERGALILDCPRAQNMLGTRLDPSYQHVYEHRKFLIEFNVPVIII